MKLAQCPHPKSKSRIRPLPEGEVSILPSPSGRGAGGEGTRLNPALKTLGLCLALAVAACSPAPELPPAKPLNASPEQLAQLPALTPGEHPVTNRNLSWAVNDQTLQLRIVAPDTDQRTPLLLFSHGFASDIDQYDALLTHWASHGYLSIAVRHPDAGGTFNAIWTSLRMGNEALVAARVAQLKSVLDHLPELETVAPGLPKRIDESRIAAAGHSFGAFTAQQLGGAAAINPESGKRIEGRDPRVQAVVAISPPGEMFEIINDQSWLSMDTPMLATTGTWDVDGRFVTQWRQHALSFDTAPAGDKHLLVVEGADHYLGNLICRLDRDASPQTDALSMVRVSTTAFLNAQLRGNTALWRALSDGELSRLTAHFARLEHR